MRTVGTTPDPVRYMYVDLPAGPPAAHEFPLQQTRAGAVAHSVSRLFPQLRRNMKRYWPKPGGCRIRPTHSPRDTADGPRNRSLSRQKPVTQSSVTGFDLRRCVAGVGFEPT